MIKKLLLFHSILLFFVKIEAQQLLPFDKEAKANCLFQDSKQKLWIGSSKGLFSYDGLNFKPFLPENNVTAIFEDAKKRLWIGYENGDIRFLNNKGETVLWEIEEGLPKAKITAFAEDKHGRFWFSTYGEGVYYYEKKHLYNVNSDDGLPSNEVYDMKKFGFFDAIWLASDAGLTQIFFNKEKRSVNTITKNHGLTDPIVTKFANDENLQIGLYNGEILESPFKWYENDYFFLRKDTSYHPNNQPITYISNNFVGTENGCLYRPYFAKNWLLPKHKINAIVEIDDVSAFIATDKGIYKYIYNYKIETPFGVQCFAQVCHYEDRCFGTYFGTKNGLYFRDDAKGKFKKIQLLASENPSISCIQQLQWCITVGTLSDGYFILDKYSGKVIKHFSTQNGLNDNCVLSTNVEYFTTIGGLYELKLPTEYKNRYKIEFIDLGKKYNTKLGYIYSVQKREDSSFLLGTDSEGLLKLDKLGNISKVKPKNGFEIKSVVEILGDNNNISILATQNQGVIFYHHKNDSIFVIDEKNGLRSNRINDIMGSQGLFVAHEKGIDFIDSWKKDWSVSPVFNDELEKNYAPYSNILDDYLSLYMLSNGISSRLGWEKAPPKIHLEKIRLYNQAIDYQQDTIFSYDKNFFNFEWCGIYYPKPDALHFQYMLDGFDRDWNDTKERNATYPQLPPGDYTFRVKALLGTYPSEEVRYHFTIKSPFWKTPFFILSLLLLSGLGIYFFIKSREKRLRKTAQLEQEKIIAQYDAIRSQVNPHFLFNTFNALVAVIETDPKQGVFFVEKLSDFFRNTLQHRDKETISIQEENSLLQDYIFILKQRFGENIIFNNQIQATEGNIVPLTLQILVENAVKHNIVSKSKPLYINILQKENYIVVENNLQKKPQHDISTKFGLEGIVKRYALLSKNDVFVTRNDDFFIVKIPIL